MAQPEQRLLTQLEVRICAGDPDQSRNAFVVGALRKGEDRRLADLPVSARLFDDGIEPGRGRFSRGLAEPKHRRLSRIPAQRIVPREAQQIRPYRNSVRQHQRKDRVLRDVALRMLRNGDQVIDRRASRHRPDIDSGRALAPAPADVRVYVPHLSAPHAQHQAHRSVLAVALPIVAMTAPGNAALSKRDMVTAIATHVGPGGVAEPHLAVLDCGYTLRDGLPRNGLRSDGQRDRRCARQKLRRARHWLINSSRNSAARGSLDWPSQKIAFFLSFWSGSFRAMSIS